MTQCCGNGLHEEVEQGLVVEIEEEGKLTGQVQPGHVFQFKVLGYHAIVETPQTGDARGNLEDVQVFPGIAHVQTEPYEEEEHAQQSPDAPSGEPFQSFQYQTARHKPDHPVEEEGIGRPPVEEHQENETAIAEIAPQEVQHR